MQFLGVKPKKTPVRLRFATPLKYAKTSSEVQKSHLNAQARTHSHVTHMRTHSRIYTRTFTRTYTPAYNDPQAHRKKNFQKNIFFSEHPPHVLTHGYTCARTSIYAHKSTRAYSHARSYMHICTQARHFAYSSRFNLNQLRVHTTLPASLTAQSAGSWHASASPLTSPNRCQPRNTKGAPHVRTPTYNRNQL